MVRRVAGNNDDEMRRLIGEDVPMEANSSEGEMLKDAMKTHWLPFVSFSICETCQGDSNSPARYLAARFEEFARIVDEDLANQILSIPKL